MACAWFAVAVIHYELNVPPKSKYCLVLRLLFQAGYIRIDGSVPASERIQLVNKFQSDPEIRVAVLSIQAAGQVLAQTNTQTLFDSTSFFILVER